MNHAHNFKDVSGQTFGYLTAIRPVSNYEFTIKSGKRKGMVMKRAVWLFRCICGKEIIKGRAYVTNSKSKTQPSCGCKKWENSKGNNHPHWRGVGEISGGYFARLKKNAKSRNIKFDVSLEYLWEIFLKQKRKCSLSGESLVFGPGEQTASVDRIDSKKSYVKGNVEWIHKNLNTMKWDLPRDTFVEWCKKVVKHV